MKTIKIIDLLNKIAKGEEVPNKIKYRYDTYVTMEDPCNKDVKYKNEKKDVDGYSKYLFQDWIIDAILNDEVQVIEEVEEDEFEDIETLNGFNITKESFDDTELGLKLGYTGVSETFNKVYFKINELVKAVNKIKNKD